MKPIKEIYPRYVGIPYKHGGRDLSQGLDCWGLVLSIYKDIGIKLMDISGYSEDWSDQGSNHFVENYSEKWERVDKPRAYDLAMFKTSPTSVPNHAGVYLGDGRIIQAVKIGVIITKINIEKLKASIYGFYRYKDLSV